MPHSSAGDPDPTPIEACVVVADAAGDVVWASPQANRVLYRNDDPVRGATLDDLFDGAIAPPTADAGRDGTDGEGVRADEGRVRRSVSLAGPDGVERTVSVVVEPVAGSEGLATYACRRATDHLDRETVLSRVTDGVIALDANWRFTYVNERAAEFVDDPAESVLGEVLWDAFPELAGSEVRERFERAMTDQEPASFEWHADWLDAWLDIRAYPSATGLTVYFRDVTGAMEAAEDRRERERQFQAVFEGTLDALVLANDDGEYVAANDAACELFGVDEADLLGRTVADFTAGDFDTAWTQFLDAGEMTGEFPLERPDGERRVLSYAATANVRPGEHLAAIRDVTDRREAERRLEAQRDELDHLNRINALIRDVNRAVVGATDRRTIERAVPDVLASADAYPLAVSFRVTRHDAIHVEHAAGPAREFVAEMRANDWDVLADTLRDVERSNVVLARHDLDVDPEYSRSLRETAVAFDLRSILFVPISYEGVVYGVLGVASGREDAFGEEERSVFGELGQILGTAIDAVQAKRLLHAKAVAELEVEAVADEMPLSTLAALVGGSWVLDGVVPLGDHEYLLYVTGEGVDPDVLEAAADDVRSVDDVRVVERDGDESTVEVRASEADAVDALLSAGGHVSGGSVEHGRTRFVVDVAPGTDVREFLSRVAQRDVDVSLRAKREVETAVANGIAPADAVALTDRQRAVLEAAYRSGYFEWPRRQTTGEELAAALDISSSTLHQHLRVALAKVLDGFYRQRPTSAE